MEKLVFHVPKWQGELVFSKEILVFVGVFLLLAVGILFCFWGYKFFRTILFVGVGIAACCGSYLLVEPMTPNLVIRMFLTVSLTFLGVCFVYFLDIIWAFILDKLGIRTAFGKRTYLLAAPLGAAVIGLTVYYLIWRDAVTAGVIAAVCLVIGLIFQHSKRKEQIRFRSYDDLMKLPRPELSSPEGGRPEIENDGLEYFSVGAAGVTGAASAAAVAASANIVPAVEDESAIEETADFTAFDPGSGWEPVEETAGSTELEAEPKSEPEQEQPEAEDAAIEPEAQPGPVEEAAGYAVFGLEPEDEEDFLEDALFVKQFNKAMKRKQAAGTVPKSGEGTGNYPGKITVTTRRDRRSGRGQWKGLAKGAALAAVGLGMFIAGRASKGGD